MSFLVKAVKKVVKVVVKAFTGGLISLVLGGKGSKGKKPKAVNRLNKTLEPEAFRKIVFGKTAAALDVRYWEVWGTGGVKYDEVLAVASHRINAFKELYLENELAIDSAGTVQANWTGILSRTTKLGAYGQTALSVGGATQWTSAATFDGAAHMCLAWVPNEKKLPNGIPERYTQVIEGAPVYDPRRDSTQAGGSGAHRITDRTTWDYAALDANSVPIGRNNALQVLWYLLGWYVPNIQTGELVLVAGRGVDPNDINIASFVTAANNCETAGYYTDGVFSTGDSHVDNETKLTADGLIGQLIDPGGLWSYYANVDDSASIAFDLTDDDVIEGTVAWNDFKPMSQQFGQVVGKFNDPSSTALYQPRAYPMVRDATYETALGVKRRKTQDFDVIQDALLAQKLARLLLNQGQYQGEFSASFLYRAMKAQIWDVVRYTSVRFGWTKLFRVVGYTITPNQGLRMSMREIHASIWTAGSVVTPAAAGAGTKYDPRQEVAVAALTAAAYATTGTAGLIVDGVLLTWTLPPVNVRRTEIQYRLSGATYWESIAAINGDTNSVGISPLLSASSYEIRARHVTIHEVESAWVNLSPNYTVTATGNNAITIRYPSTSPTIAPLGSIYIDATGKQFRFEGTPVTTNGVTATSGANSITDSGWVEVQDLAIAAAATTANWTTITGNAKPQDNADVTAQSVPSLTVPATLTINADYLGAITDSLPITLICKRLLGTTNVDDTTVWSASFPPGITGTIDSTSAGTTRGDITITAATGSGYIGDITVTAIRDGVTLTAKTAVTMNVAAAPSAGGAGATSATITSYVAVSSSSYGTVTGGPVTVRAPASGNVTVSGSLSYTVPNTTLGNYGLAIKAQVGGVDIATEVISSAEAQVYSEPPNVALAGTITFSFQKTGLVSGTDYSFQVLARRAGSNSGSTNRTISGTTNVVQS